MGNLSDFGAFINILKGQIGLAILTLPYATKQVGWVPAVLGLALVGVLTVLGIFFAVFCKLAVDPERIPLDQMDRKQQARPPVSIGSETSGVDTGLGFFDKLVGEVLGPTGKWVCSASIFLCQFATGVAYIACTVDSLEVYMPAVSHVRHYIYLGLFLVLTLLSSVRTLRGVSVLSACGVLLYLAILLALCCIAVQELFGGGFSDTITAAVPPQQANYGAFFGTTLFAFGAFSVAIVVYDEMYEQRHFFKVCSLSYCASFLLYALFGTIGYFCYGAATEDIIYLNFPEGSLLRNGCVCCFCVVLSFTYVLQMYPCFNFVELAIGKAHYMLPRVLLILASFLVAMSVPDTSFVIRVYGSLSAVISSFVLPTVVYFLVSERVTIYEYVLGAGLLLLAVGGTVQAVVDAMS